MRKQLIQLSWYSLSENYPTKNNVEILIHLVDRGSDRDYGYMLVYIDEDDVWRMSFNKEVLEDCDISLIFEWCYWDILVPWCSLNL